MTEYLMYLLDRNRQRIGQVEHFKRATFIKRMNDLSAWSVELDYGSPEFELLNWGYGIEVLRDEEPYMQGYYLGFDESGIEPGVDTTMIFGVDLMLYLSTRLAVPVPAGPPYSSAEFDIRNGFAGDIIKQYVNYNAGPLAKAVRQYPFTVADPNSVGKADSSGRARFDNLLDFCAKLALDGGDIQFYFDGTVFDCKELTDKTSSVIFSQELGNLLNIKRRREVPKANYMMAGGVGEGTSRELIEVLDPDSVLTFGRVEEFYDYRQGTGAELYNATAGRLKETTAKTVIEVTTTNTESVMYARDYDIGDVVKVLISDTESYSYPVREVKVDLTPDGENVTEQIDFVIGSAGARLMVEESTRLTKIQTKDLSNKMRIMERI